MGFIASMCWVDRCFEVEEEVQVQLADKRRKLLSGVGVVPPEVQQQRAFLAMTQTGEQVEGKFSQRTVYRVAARRWVCNIDNQLQRSTCFHGLFSFIPNEAQGKWEDRNWRGWPGIGFARDGGSDGNTGIHACLHLFKMNCWDWMDNSHSSGRSFEGALKDAGLWEMWLLLLISWNLPWGPNDDEYRRNQLDEGMKHFFTLNTEESPMFQDHVCEIAQDLEDGGVVTFPREKPLQQEVFEFVKSQSLLAKTGRRTSNCRFGGTLHAALYNLPYWGMQAFQRKYVALKLGHLQNKKTLDKLTVKFQTPEVDDASTNPKKITVESKALKSCCKNALVVSVMVLMEKDHKRLVQIVANTSIPMRVWHTEQNRELRDVHATKAWLIRQLDKDLMLYFFSFLAQLCDQQVLRKCQFQMPLNSQKLDGQDVLEFQLEDDFADYMGNFSASMTKQTMKRLCYMYSYPHRHIHQLIGDTNKKALLKSDFRKVIEVFMKFLDAEGKGKVQKIMLSRHPLNTTPGRRAMLAFADKEAGAMADFEEIISEMAQGCPQTQIVEDIIGSQKNSKTVRNYTKVKRPEVSMGMVLEQKILERKHKYTPIDMSIPMVGSAPKIPSAAFNQSKASWTHDWKPIASTKQSPDFYSPSAQFNGAHYTDLPCLDKAIRSADGFSSLEKLFYGCIFDASHRSSAW